MLTDYQGVLLLFIASTIVVVILTHRKIANAAIRLVSICNADLKSTRIVNANLRLLANAYGYWEHLNFIRCQKVRIVLKIVFEKVTHFLVVLLCSILSTMSMIYRYSTISCVRHGVVQLECYRFCRIIFQFFFSSTLFHTMVRVSKFDVFSLMPLQKCSTFVQCPCIKAGVITFIYW